MGLFYPTTSQANKRVGSDVEVGTLSKQAGKRGMALLEKDQALTFNNGTLQSNLDHLLATVTLAFVQQGNDAAGNPASVAVRGWNQLSGAAQKKFIEEISDHASLFAEVS